MRNFARFKFGLVAFSLILSVLFGMVPKAWADLLANRSLKIASVKASDTTTHTVTFNFTQASTVGSLVFEYCDNPLFGLLCNAPNGINASAATLTAQNGEVGFSILSHSANRIVLSRTAAAVGLQTDSYEFSNVVNPADMGAFYLRISAYTSTDGTGTATDQGATVADITQGVTITTEVPPILDFCVGVSIPAQCDSASGDFLDLGNFQTNATAKGTTQFMLGTNAGFGYVVTASGSTMTSGNNIIPAIAAPAPSQVGNSQFGINLRANSSPNVGTDPSGGSGVPTPDYNTPNLFKFAAGDVIAGHNYTSSLERYTVSYIVNVSPSQPVGVYNTTVTYTVTATF